MQIEQKDLITENDRNKLRQKALHKELSRLKNLTHKKYKEIYLYRVSIVILLAIAVGTYYHFQNNTNQAAQVLQNAIPNHEFVDSVPKKPFLKSIYYSVAFENASQYPLAQFKNIADAESFTRQLTKMNLPSIEITRDSISKMHNSSNKQMKAYAIQLGAYNVDFLEKYHKNLIWLQLISEDNYFKYRFAPFQELNATKTLAKKLEIEEPYILRY